MTCGTTRALRPPSHGTPTVATPPLPAFSARASPADVDSSPSTCLRTPVVTAARAAPYNLRPQRFSSVAIITRGIIFRNYKIAEKPPTLPHPSLFVARLFEHRPRRREGALETRERGKIGHKRSGTTRGGGRLDSETGPPPFEPPANNVDFNFFVNRLSSRKLSKFILRLLCLDLVRSFILVCASFK